MAAAVFQMLPLLKKSTDNLVSVMGENATSGKSFDALKYVSIPPHVLDNCLHVCV